MTNKDKFQQKLINRYKELSQKEKTTLSVTIGGMYRDEMRKIEKIYFKNFKEPIDKSIKMWYNINVIKGSHPHNKSGRKER